ncbi:MAG: asparaginase [Phycisphaerae bacterium]|nr:MAG: asparaginase [Phycisphaerae bacterium]
MPDSLSRRAFLRSVAIAAGGTAAGSALAAESEFDGAAQSAGDSPIGTKGGGGPVVISSANGLPATAKAMSMLNAHKDPLDAVVAGVNIVELDPNDHSVGYGGLPNEDGVVELDSCVMHGPTHNAGAVAALRNIKTPSQVAKLVMERTDHVLVVGEGALRFAKAHGFEESELLTDDARKIWLRWKEARANGDWLPPVQAKPDRNTQSSAGSDMLRHPAGFEYTYGTINCCALDAKGDLAGVTTTSGLSYKIPGRVGDSPIIGAGLFVDNAVGAAGSTGRGEAVILNCGSASVVEMMRGGATPTEACLKLLKRMVDHNIDPRLRNDDGTPNFDVKMYAVRKDGLHGSAAIWSGAKYAVFSENRNRLEESAFLFERHTR